MSLPNPHSSQPRVWWRILRRALIAFACLVTLVAAFYTVENWRGRRAWEQCRRELEARDEILDWEKFIPPPIPDEENFFKAPGMLSWFSRKTQETNQGVRIYSVPAAMSLMSSSVGIFEKLRSLPERAPESATNHFDLATAAIPGLSVQVLPWIGFTNEPAREVIEQLARLANLKVVFAKSLDSSVNLTRVTPFWRANLTARAALADFLEKQWLAARWDDGASTVEIVPLTKPASPGVSRAALREEFAHYEPEYRLLADACARPRSRLADDYSVPFSVDVPSFVNARNVAQTLSVHAALSLLDEKPDVAVADLAMMRRIGEVMEDSHTLVGTMIHVAIEGLYLQTAREALEAGLWKEPQLATLQRQTRDLNLLESLSRSWHGAERAGVIRLLDRPRAELARAFVGRRIGSNSDGAGLDWPLLFMRLKLELCPRGWIQQNQASLARFDQELLDTLDTSSRRIQAARLDALGKRWQELSPHRPYTFLAARAMPNFIRAVQTLARNETQLEQFHVACALERYRLAHGGYPEKLEALLPDLLDRVPKDLFADSPLQYRRDEQGGYLLWSVGWDEKDDGGVASKPAYEPNPGDWVWTHAR